VKPDEDFENTRHIRYSQWSLLFICLEQTLNETTRIQESNSTEIVVEGYLKGLSDTTVSKGVTVNGKCGSERLGHLFRPEFLQHTVLVCLERCVCDDLGALVCLIR